MGGGQDFSDDVEDRVIVEGVADLLELLVQALEDAAFDGVGGDEVEDEAVLALAVAVDAAHPLLQAVRVPGDIVVEEDVAGLEVDPFAGRFGGDEDLDLAFPELLLGEGSRPPARRASAPSCRREYSRRGILRTSGRSPGGPGCPRTR